MLPYRSSWLCDSGAGLNSAAGSTVRCMRVLTRSLGSVTWHLGFAVMRCFSTSKASLTCLHPTTKSASLQLPRAVDQARPLSSGNCLLGRPNVSKQASRVGDDAWLVLIRCLGKLHEPKAGQWPSCQPMKPATHHTRVDRGGSDESLSRAGPPPRRARQAETDKARQAETYKT